MRWIWRCVAGIAGAYSVACVPGSAFAQGFLDGLFGGGGGPQQQAPGSRYSLPPPVQSPFGYRTPYYNPYRAPAPRDIDEMPQSRSGQYRTLCVRMCDGYYWPISHTATRGNFYRDANICRASCGEDARLFYHSNKDGDVGEMVDLTGRAYTKLATAFRYRKIQIEGCKCKPDPWAQSELNRHRLYALNETEDERRRKEQLVAGPVAREAKPGLTARQAALPVEPQVPSADDEKRAPAGEIRAVIAPEPIEQPRPRLPKNDTRVESYPGRTPKPAIKPALIRPATLPATHPGTPGLNGGGGGAKSRWPGD